MGVGLGREGCVVVRGLVGRGGGRVGRGGAVFFFFGSRGGRGGG